MDPPLKGIRILDLSQSLTGPFCSMILADLGAEVIKIEIPEVGDMTRSWGPPFIGGESAYFLCVNRNKKSITLNLKTDKGKKILYRLAEKCDVFLENFRPGVTDKLGVNYETIHEINSHMIYCSISGFGQTGPYRDWPAYDIVVQGLGGFMGITGESGRPPVRVGVAITDILAGAHATIAILSALIARKTTGKGQWIDMSMFDGAVSWMTYMAANYFATGKVPERMGSAHPNIVPYQCFETKDRRYINIAIGNDRLWTSLCKVLGLEKLAQDPKFATNPMRVENRNELISMLTKVFLTKTRNEWLKILGREIPCGPVYTMDEIFSDHQVLHRGMLVEIDHPVAGKIKQIGIPMKFSETPGEIKAPPPLLGQHTEEILKKFLKLSEKDVSQLRKEKVI